MTDDAEMIDRIARAMAPAAWDAVGEFDTPGDLEARSASISHARAALIAIQECGYAVVPVEPVPEVIHIASLISKPGRRTRRRVKMKPPFGINGDEVGFLAFLALLIAMVIGIQAVVFWV